RRRLGLRLGSGVGDCPHLGDLDCLLVRLPLLRRGTGCVRTGGCGGSCCARHCEREPRGCELTPWPPLLQREGERGSAMIPVSPFFFQRLCRAIATAAPLRHSRNLLAGIHSAPPSGCPLRDCGHDGCSFSVKPIGRQSPSQEEEV